MLTQEYHMEPPVTVYCLLTRDGDYFQMINQYAARDKHSLSTMPYCNGASPTDIRMWYQSVSIHSAIHKIYVHPYYCFRPEANDSKLFSAGNDTNKTKHNLPEKNLQ